MIGGQTNPYKKVKRKKNNNVNRKATILLNKNTLYSSLLK